MPRKKHGVQSRQSSTQSVLRGALQTSPSLDALLAQADAALKQRPRTHRFTQASRWDTHGCGAVGCYPDSNTQLLSSVLHPSTKELQPEPRAADFSRSHTARTFEQPPTERTSQCDYTPQHGQYGASAPAPAFGKPPARAATEPEKISEATGCTQVDSRWKRAAAHGFGGAPGSQRGGWGGRKLAAVVEWRWIAQLG